MTQSLSKWLSNIWVYADDELDCSVCGASLEMGERIRSIGEAGWQGKSCCGSEEETK